MTEISRPWGGSATGDAGPYTDEHWQEVWRSLLGAGDDEGVLPDQLNDLVVTGSASPVAVDTGRAIVHGIWYENDASVNVTVPTPGGATRVDIIVLQKDWTAQTVRIARHAGTEGAGVPTLTQTDGVTWEIPLAQASITTGGAITLTDVRVFPPGLIPRGGIMLFTTDCPKGWSEYTAARGRYVVGTPSGGTDEGTVGTALTDLENRATGVHSHTFTGSALGTHTHTFTGDAMGTHGHGVTDPGHGHALESRDISDTGSGTILGESYVSGGVSTSVNTTGATVDAGSAGTPSGTNSATSGGTPAGTVNNSSGTAGTNAPYIQLRYCQKD